MEDLEKYSTAQLLLRIKELEERISKLEEGSMSKGYYLDGTPAYVKEYARTHKLIGDEDE